MPEIGRPGGDATAREGDTPLEVATARSGVATILVVDDDPAVLELVASALSRHGYEPITASGGREALRAVYERTTTPALLITDITMPVMTGIELAARLTAERPGIRVILMTGDPASAESALQRPTMVAGVLLKPFTVADLTAQVESALRPTP